MNQIAVLIVAALLPVSVFGTDRTSSGGNTAEIIFPKALKQFSNILLPLKPAELSQGNMEDRYVDYLLDSFPSEPGKPSQRLERFKYVLERGVKLQFQDNFCQKPGVPGSHDICYKKPNIIIVSKKAFRAQDIDSIPAVALIGHEVAHLAGDNFSNHGFLSGLGDALANFSVESVFFEEIEGYDMYPLSILPFDESEIDHPHADSPMDFCNDVKVALTEVLSNRYITFDIRCIYSSIPGRVNMHAVSYVKVEEGCFSDSPRTQTSIGSIRWDGNADSQVKWCEKMYYKIRSLSTPIFKISAPTEELCQLKTGKFKNGKWDEHVDIQGLKARIFVED